jgi:hypothetical protein
MLEEPDGRRVLLAPTDRVAEFVSSTYTFDQVVVGPVEVVAGGESRTVTGPGLRLTLRVGSRTALGVLLRLQPRPFVGSPRWARLLDPIARAALPGVRTQGSAGGGRREFYGASDLHRLVGVEGVWRDQPLGRLAAVEPAVRFGFGSAPSRPSLTRITTTIVEN